MSPVYTLIVRAILSVIFCVFYGWIVLNVLGREQEILDGIKEVLLFLLGALTTAVVRVISFWFDSSQGSADKSAALARAATEGRQ
jgi:hypothetical protein